MVLDFIDNLWIFFHIGKYLLELMVLGLKTSLDILPNWKNFQRINHNSFVDY
jgi:hypothetical protein